MSEKPTTKSVEVQSCHICERHDDKHMIMTISSRVGSFEFDFSPEQWQRLGLSAGWFEEHVRAPLPVNGEKIMKQEEK